MCQLEHGSDQTCSDIVTKLVKEGCQVKKHIYEKSQKTVDVFADGLQSLLNALSNDILDVATLANVFQTASDVPPAPAFEAETGSCCQRHSLERFQFEAEP